MDTERQKAGYAIHWHISALQPPLENMGARLDVQVRVPYESCPDEILSSSSVILCQSSSSSSVPADFDLFLYRRTDTVDEFLGICSPMDMNTWPQSAPTASTGLFRSDNISLTFRTESILDDAWAMILADIRSLVDILDVLAALQSAEDKTYDFSGSSADESSSSLWGVRRFQLHRAAITAYPAASPTGYRMTVTCSADGTDSKIFLHRDDEADRAGVTYARPIAVCSPGDLVDYPEDEVLAGAFPAHYRLSTFDIVSKDIELLDEVWDNIKVDTQDLAAALQYHMETITESATENLS